MGIVIFLFLSERHELCYIFVLIRLIGINWGDRVKHGMLKAKCFKHVCKWNMRVKRDPKHTCRKSTFECTFDSSLQEFINNKYMLEFVHVEIVYGPKIFYPLRLRTNLRQPYEDDGNRSTNSSIELLDGWDVSDSNMCMMDAIGTFEINWKTERKSSKMELPG